jgi:hypothetical protein
MADFGAGVEQPNSPAVLSQGLDSNQVWEPIVSDRLRESAEESIYAIASHLLNCDPTQKTPFALCESALLFAYLYVVEPAAGWDVQAIDYLNLALEQISHQNQRVLGLYGGLSGVGWIVEHVSNLFSHSPPSRSTTDVVEDPGDPISDIDSLLVRLLARGPWEGTYDLVGGLVGFGVYLLERLPRKSALEGLKIVLSRLEEEAKHSSEGTAWFTPAKFMPIQQSEVYPDGHFNLGVAHGVPGVIHFLGELVAIGLESARAAPLLESSLRWLKAQQRPADELYRYACAVVPGKQEFDSRSAWCYGDAGIAGLLFRMATVLGLHEWRLAAVVSWFIGNCAYLPKDLSN